MTTREELHIRPHYAALRHSHGELQETSFMIFFFENYSLEVSSDVLYLLYPVLYILKRGDEIVGVSSNFRKQL